MLVPACSSLGASCARNLARMTTPFTLTSPAFAHGASIPARYTCDGDNFSPPLEWSAPPEGTRSLVLIVDDPDAPDPAAPKMRFVHWVLMNLPPRSGGLPEGGSSKLPPGTREGMTDFRRTGWGGPCPPIGRHRYVFTLYALVRPLELPPAPPPTRDQVLRAMEGQVLARAELIGTYARRGKA